MKGNVHANLVFGEQVRMMCDPPNKYRCQAQFLDQTDEVRHEICMVCVVWRRPEDIVSERAVVYQHDLRWL